AFRTINFDTFSNSGVFEGHINASAYNPMAVLQGVFDDGDAYFAWLKALPPDHVTVLDADGNPMPGAEARLLELNPQGWTFGYEAPTPGTLRLAASYTKSWRYRVDGGAWQPVEPSPSGPLAYDMSVPAGSHRVELQM